MQPLQRSALIFRINNRKKRPHPLVETSTQKTIARLRQVSIRLHRELRVLQRAFEIFRPTLSISRFDLTLQ